MSDSGIPDQTTPDVTIRTYSLMALASAFASLASVGGCALAGLAAYFLDPTAAVVIFVAPIVAIIGAVLGSLALRAIRRSEGQLGGRPLATIGLFVGLCGAVLQLSVALSALATIWPVRTVLAPEVGAFMQDVASGQLDAAGARLSEPATQALPDERLTAFARALEDRLGPFQGAGFGLDVFVESRKRIQALMARGPAPGAPPPANSPKPIGLTFASSRAIAYVVVDQDLVAKGQVRIEDVLVLMPDDRGIVLRENSDAARTALALGVALVRIEGRTEGRDNP